MNDREEAVVELIKRGAFTHAHDEMLKLTEEERANVENNTLWDVFDGYEQFVKGLKEAPKPDVDDDIPRYEGTSN